MAEKQYYTLPHSEPAQKKYSYSLNDSSQPNEQLDKYGHFKNASVVGLKQAKINQIYTKGTFLFLLKW